ncbi:hypothetical protein [Nocardioides alpinus]|uniref:hypothetical protein n=1 Tax=Nocardioides alpinus TaxID=748909 RepID=UPI0012FEA464|nr:hypothetical protein [Nocardioides alpinus]
MRRPTPTSAAIAARVVCSKPRSANSRNAAASISAWVVASGRPSTTRTSCSTT